MITSICYITLGLCLKKISTNKYNIMMSKTLINIGFINLFCNICLYITKIMLFKIIGTLSIVLGLITHIKISKLFRQEQKEKQLILDSLEIIEKLSK